MGQIQNSVNGIMNQVLAGTIASSMKENNKIAKDTSDTQVRITLADAKAKSAGYEVESHDLKKMAKEIAADNREYKKFIKKSEIAQAGDPNYDKWVNYNLDLQQKRAAAYRKQSDAKFNQYTAYNELYESLKKGSNV